MQSISVLIPTYNSESTLQQCVKSLHCSAEQAKIKIEIYIFDNRSDDNTLAHAKELYNSDLISGCQCNGRNIGIATFYKMANWYIKSCSAKDSWSPVFLMDSEDTVPVDYFSFLCFAAQSAAHEGCSLVIPQYALRSLTYSSMHNRIGTNSFFFNAKYLPLKTRWLACLLSPGAVGYSSMVWGCLYLNSQPFDRFRSHTKKFVMDPGLLPAAWENTLCANLLLEFDYMLSSGVLYRGCTNSKFFEFPGADSALASFIYINDGSLSILETARKHDLVPEDIRSSLSDIINHKVNFSNLVQSFK